MYTLVKIRMALCPAFEFWSLRYKTLRWAWVLKQTRVHQVINRTVSLN